MIRRGYMITEVSKERLEKLAVELSSKRYVPILLIEGGLTFEEFVFLYNKAKKNM